MLYDLVCVVLCVGEKEEIIKKTVRAGQNKKGTGMIINSSRGIIFSKDPREAAKELKAEINKYRII